MSNYEVTIYFSETYTVEANSEAEAKRKAYDMYKAGIVAMIPDEYEVKSLGDKAD